MVHSTRRTSCVTVSLTSCPSAGMPGPRRDCTPGLVLSSTSRHQVRGQLSGIAGDAVPAWVGHATSEAGSVVAMVGCPADTVDFHKVTSGSGSGLALGGWIPGAQLADVDRGFIHQLPGRVCGDDRSVGRPWFYGSLGATSALPH